MLTHDQQTALLMEIADLRIRLANVEAANERLQGELLIAQAAADTPRRRQRKPSE